jgi:hypothetical protein
VARKERKGGAAARLEAEMAAGDWRAARGAAEALAASGGDEERSVAAGVLERLRPGPTARLAFVAGLVLFAIVAAAGLTHR